MILSSTATCLVEHAFVPSSSTKTSPSIQSPDIQHLELSCAKTSPLNALDEAILPLDAITLPSSLGIHVVWGGSCFTLPWSGLATDIIDTSSTAHPKPEICGIVGKESHRYLICRSISKDTIILPLDPTPVTLLPSLPHMPSQLISYAAVYGHGIYQISRWTDNPAAGEISHSLMGALSPLYTAVSSIDHVDGWIYVGGGQRSHLSFCLHVEAIRMKTTSDPEKYRLEDNRVSWSSDITSGTERILSCQAFHSQTTVYLMLLLSDHCCILLSHCKLKQGESDFKVDDANTSLTELKRFSNILQVSIKPSTGFILLSRSGEVSILDPVSLNYVLQTTIDGGRPEYFQILCCFNETIVLFHSPEFKLLKDARSPPPLRQSGPREESNKGQWTFRSVLSFLKSRSRAFISVSYFLSVLTPVSPKEKLMRQLAQKSYQSALELAQTYALPTDPIYKAMWLDRSCDEASIYEILDCIQDKQWVFNTCASYRTENLKALKLLYKYALKQTDIVTLARIHYEIDCVLDDKEASSIAEGTDAIWPSSTTICQRRRQFLSFLDRLDSYIYLYGYKEFGTFDSFRDTDLLTLALSFAKKADFVALEVLFTRHGASLLSRKLELLSAIPLSIDPVQYKKFLPLVFSNANEVDQVNLSGSNGEEWCVIPWRSEIDWVESAEIDDFLGESESLKSLMGGMTSVHDWYLNRIYAIDESTGQVSYCLELAKFGVNNGAALEEIVANLWLLSTILYDLTPQDGSIDIIVDFSFRSLEAMSIPDRLCLIVNGSASTEGGLESAFDHIILVYASKLKFDLSDHIFELISSVDSSFASGIVVYLLDNVEHDYVPLDIVVGCIGHVLFKDGIPWHCNYEIEQLREADASLKRFNQSQERQSFVLWSEEWGKEIAPVTWSIDELCQLLVRRSMELPLATMQSYIQFVRISELFQKYGKTYPPSKISYMDPQRIITELARTPIDDLDLDALPSISGGIVRTLVSNVSNSLKSENASLALINELLDIGKWFKLDGINVYCTCLESMLHQSSMWNLLYGRLYIGGDKGLNTNEPISKYLEFSLLRKLLKPGSGFPSLPQDKLDQILLNAASEFFDNADSFDSKNKNISCAISCLKLGDSPSLRAQLDFIHGACQIGQLLPEMYPVQMKAVVVKMQLIERVCLKAREEFISSFLILEAAAKIMGSQFTSFDHASVYLWLIQAAIARNDIPCLKNTVQALGKFIQSHESNATVMHQRAYISTSTTYGALSSNVMLNRPVSLGYLFAFGVLECYYHLREGSKEWTNFEEDIKSHLQLALTCCSPDQMPGILNILAIPTYNANQGAGDEYSSESLADLLKPSLFGKSLEFKSFLEHAFFSPCEMTVEHAFIERFLAKLERLNPPLTEEQLLFSAIAYSSIDTSLAISYLFHCEEDSVQRYDQFFSRKDPRIVDIAHRIKSVQIFDLSKGESFIKSCRDLIIDVISCSSKEISAFHPDRDLDKKNISQPLLLQVDHFTPVPPVPPQYSVEGWDADSGWDTFGDSAPVSPVKTSPPMNDLLPFGGNSTTIALDDDVQPAKNLAEQLPAKHEDGWGWGFDDPFSADSPQLTECTPVPPVESSSREALSALVAEAAAFSIAKVPASGKEEKDGWGFDEMFSPDTLQLMESYNSPSDGMSNNLATHLKELSSIQKLESETGTVLPQEMDGWGFEDSLFQENNVDTDLNEHILEAPTPKLDSATPVPVTNADPLELNVIMDEEPVSFNAPVVDGWGFDEPFSPDTSQLLERITEPVTEQNAKDVDPANFERYLNDHEMVKSEHGEPDLKVDGWAFDEVLDVDRHLASENLFQEDTIFPPLYNQNTNDAAVLEPPNFPDAFLEISDNNSIVRPPLDMRRLQSPVGSLLPNINLFTTTSDPQSSLILDSGPKDNEPENFTKSHEGDILHLTSPHGPTKIEIDVHSAEHKTIDNNDALHHVVGWDIDDELVELEEPSPNPIIANGAQFAYLSVDDSGPIIGENITKNPKPIFKVDPDIQLMSSTIGWIEEPSVLASGEFQMHSPLGINESRSDKKVAKETVSELILPDRNQFPTSASEYAATIHGELSASATQRIPIDSLADDLIADTLPVAPPETTLLIPVESVNIEDLDEEIKPMEFDVTDSKELGNDENELPESLDANAWTLIRSDLAFSLIDVEDANLDFRSSFQEVQRSIEWLVLQNADPLGIEKLVQIVSSYLPETVTSTTYVFTTLNLYSKYLDRLLSFQDSSKPLISEYSHPALGTISKDKILDLIEGMACSISNCVYIDTNDLLGDGWDVMESLYADNSSAELVKQLGERFQCAVVACVAKSHPWSQELLTILKKHFESGDALQQTMPIVSLDTASQSPEFALNDAWDFDDDGLNELESPTPQEKALLQLKLNSWSSVVNCESLQESCRMIESLVRDMPADLRSAACLSECQALLSSIEYPGDAVNCKFTVLLARIRHFDVLSKTEEESLFAEAFKISPALALKVAWLAKSEELLQRSGDLLLDCLQNQFERLKSEWEPALSTLLLLHIASVPSAIQTLTASLLKGFPSPSVLAYRYAISTLLAAGDVTSSANLLSIEKGIPQQMLIGMEMKITFLECFLLEPIKLFGDSAQSSACADFAVEFYGSEDIARSTLDAVSLTAGKYLSTFR